ncbi:hypothetical protein [Novacetimonas pomaceti]|uniref:hypothetical protein n=1 Tax=Novacetimonas pomaceti TaxID=2021998 RepID=UPI001C2D1294|nr:hypothetical protein [Novacetimonas pomaceti]MBV1833043.1 hypothetical protein [Novacetimonas pomaceti]
MRSREEQIEDLTNAFGEEGTFSYIDDRDAAIKHIDEAIQRGRELERAEMGGRLRSSLDAQIATHMQEGTNPDAPAWVWLGDCDRQEVSLGRWNKHPNQALFIRSDLIRDAMTAETNQ